MVANNNDYGRFERMPLTQKLVMVRLRSTDQSARTSSHCQRGRGCEADGSDKFVAIRSSVGQDHHDRMQPAMSPWELINSV